jgi:hypothetical protein
VRELAEKYVESRRRLNRRTKFELKRVSGSLPDLLSLLPPMTMRRTRRLLIPTQSEWVVCFNNGYHQDAISFTYTASQLGFRGLHVVAVLNAYSRLRGGRLGQLGFCLLEAGQPTIHPARQVVLTFQEREADFWQCGEPLPWENMERYAKRRKADRMTLEELARIVAGFGIEPFREDFYRSQDAIMIEQKLGFFERYRLKTISLEEAWRKAQWQPSGGKVAGE